jgi:DNA repair exonuclease SbcCD ATPase subunit
MMMVGHYTGLLYGGWKIGIPEVPLPWTYREELPRGGWSQLPADELAKVRLENERLIDEVQAHAEVSLAAIDARAQAEHELATAQARIEELTTENERLRSLVQCCSRDHNFDGNCDRHPKGLQARIEELERENRDLRAKHYEQPWTVNEAEQLRQRATAAEAERDKLREAFLKEPTDETHN